MGRALWLGVFGGALLGTLSCSGTRASIEIEDARTSFVNYPTTRRVNIDVDLLAHDQLGGPIGQYCVQAVIPYQDTQNVCFDDLADGDRKTLRIQTLGDCADALGISLTLRHASISIGRDVVGPTAPKP